MHIMYVFYNKMFKLLEKKKKRLQTKTFATLLLTIQNIMKITTITSVYVSYFISLVAG